MTEPTTTDGRTYRRQDNRRRRRPILRRSRKAPQIRIDRATAAEQALHTLVNEGEFIQRGRRQYLVAHVTPAMMETISIGLAATEDEEENGDLEPSIGTQDDLESDGLDRGENDSGWQDVGGSAGYNQLHLHCDPSGTVDDEDGDPSFDPCDLGEPKDYLQ